jgi:hypothetical protein
MIGDDIVPAAHRFVRVHDESDRTFSSANGEILIGGKLECHKLRKQGVPETGCSRGNVP